MSVFIALEIGRYSCATYELQMKEEDASKTVLTAVNCIRYAYICMRE